MGKRLTDKQKKQIIADYVEIGSYNAVAKENGISINTVKKIVKENPEFARICEQKKEQNSADILAHMETQKNKVCEIIDVYLEKLLDPLILARATPSQLTTALGTLIDKFTAVKVAEANGTPEDDALTIALKEEAERMQNADIE